MPSSSTRLEPSPPTSPLLRPSRSHPDGTSALPSNQQKRLALTSNSPPSRSPLSSTLPSSQALTSARSNYPNPANRPRTSWISLPSPTSISPCRPRISPPIKSSSPRPALSSEPATIATTISSSHSAIRSEATASSITNRTTASKASAPSSIPNSACSKALSSRTSSFTHGTANIAVPPDSPLPTIRNRWS